MQTFASPEDVQARAHFELSAAEELDVELLLILATAAIALAAGKDEEWADALDPVPEVLRGITISLVLREMQNPSGLASLQEQLGNYSVTETYRRAAAGGALGLTDSERLIVRRVVNGKLVASSRVKTTADQLYPNDPAGS